MTLSDMAAIGEAIGGIAVLITVMYLAYQFRQTSIIERTAGNRELLARARDWVELTTVNPDLVDVLRDTLDDWHSSSPKNQERANGWMLSAALQAEQALYMKREGLINDQSYNGFLGVIVAIARTPGGSEWWKSARIALGNDISDLVDSKLADVSTDMPNWLEIFPHLKKGNSE